MKLFLMLVLAFFLACSASHSKSNSNKPQKLDAPLQQKVEAAEKNDSEEPIKFLGKCNQPVTEEMRAQLAASGVAIGTVTGDIFTASGTARQIRELAKHDAITQLSLSVERKF